MFKGRLGKALKNPKKIIKFIEDGGDKGRAKKILSQIRDYSKDQEIIKDLEIDLGIQMNSFYNELINNHDFRQIEENVANNWRNLGALGTLEARMVYLICRAIKPKSVIETGVANGLSSSIFLLSIAKNKIGTLHSIDISSDSVRSEKGATVLPPGKKVGWIIPEELKCNWEFNVGDSKKILPEILNREGCDIFLHDSDHSYEHMMWEFETVKPFVKKIIISDDISRNNSFTDFASKYNYSTIKISKHVGIIIMN